VSPPKKSYPTTTVHRKSPARSDSPASARLP